MQMLTRAFFALRLPDELHAPLQAAQMELKRRGGAEVARWTSPTDWSVILCPLGELSPPQLGAASDVGRAIAARHQPLELVIAGVGGTPNATQPRLAWAGVESHEQALERLQVDLEAALKPLALPRESRPLMAHVPLARLKIESEQGRSALGRAVRVAAVAAIGEWRADHLDLVKTDIGPSGPVQVTLERFPFG